MDQVKIGTIEEELAACRAAFKGVEVGAIVEHCHHEIHREILREPAENRIAYILARKPVEQHAARLHFFRPWPVAELPPSVAAAGEKYGAAGEKYGAAWKNYEAAWENYEASPEFAATHARLFPDCHGENIFD